MIRRTITGLLIGLSLTLLTLPSHADGSGNWVDGEDIYKKVCAYCHEVGIAPYLLGRQFPAVVVEYMARNGSRAMPAMKPSFIDDAALKSVAEYIEKSKAGPNAPQSLLTDPHHKETVISATSSEVPTIAATTPMRTEE